MSATKTVPDSRRYWKKKAEIRGNVIAHLQADLDAVETELKQLLAKQAACTCQPKDARHGN